MPASFSDDPPRRMTRVTPLVTPHPISMVPVSTTAAARSQPAHLTMTGRARPLDRQQIRRPPSLLPSLQPSLQRKGCALRTDRTHAPARTRPRVQTHAPVKIHIRVLTQDRSANCIIGTQV